MKRRFIAFVFAVCLLVPASGLAQAVRVSPAERRMADAITAAQLSSYLHFVASDAMEGRDTPSRGLDITAEFLKMQLSRWGMKPAGDDGTFFQKIAIRVESIDPANNLLQIEGRQFNLNEHFYRMAGNGSASSHMVFVGHGWHIRSKNIDAYQGVDVRGKIVVIRGEGFPNRNSITRMPAGVTEADLTGTKGVDWSDPVTYARSKGAAGILLIASPQMQAAWAQAGQFFTRGSMYPEKLRPATGAPADTLPVAVVSRPVSDAIFAGSAGTIQSATPFVIEKTASITTMTRTETKWTQNVVALWEGAGPLKDEMVAIGAHYDHVGTNPNAPGPDKIWNGADDDGSGTVAVLAIAEALSKARTRPKRSVLFVWHAGEEKGLWGSAYFNKFPTVDISKVVAQLNIDMIGRSKKPGDTDQRNANLTGPDSIYVIGSEMMSTTLGAITKRTNDAFLKLNYDYKYDDPKDTERFFFRSDHYHYAKNGIPIVFWFDGVHEDYHQPGDHADKIDYAKMEKVTRTIFMTLWELTELRTRPAVDKTLPPELAGER